MENLANPQDIQFLVSFHPPRVLSKKTFLRFLTKIIPPPPAPWTFLEIFQESNARVKVVNVLKKTFRPLAEIPIYVRGEIGERGRSLRTQNKILAGKKS